MGILWSYHPDNKTQRYYDEAALERLKQILILRKFQIPIKDIARIYQKEDTASMIQAFVNKLDNLDDEIANLSELRYLVDEFLHKMLNSGIQKISAITFLYEETERRLVNIPESEKISLEKLSEVSQKSMSRHDIRIIRLPQMKVLTSRLKTGEIVELDESILLLREWIAGHEYFEIDMEQKGRLYRYEMIEEILPWDIAELLERYQQDIFVPIRIKSSREGEENG